MGMNSNKPPLIYNLFPRYLGLMNKWIDHIVHIKKMGFNWIYVNPFNYPGFSGSLYAIKHHYIINPLFVDPYVEESPEEQLLAFIESAHSNKVRVMMDLVLRHTSVDSPLIEEHPDWYIWDEFKQLKNPMVWENNQWKKWGDLALINNAGSPDRGNLWQYWNKLANFYIRLGIDGFLCDSAHNIPLELWEFLIKQCKRAAPHVVFVAQNLGATSEQIADLTRVGFDYVLNSSKYWNYEDTWCLEQYQRIAPFPTISFPEFYFTPRLAKETNDNWNMVKQRYIFSAVFSTGLLMPIGFEFGFHKNLDVQNQMPTDFEQVRVDLTGIISDTNKMKKQYRVFAEEGPISPIICENPDLFVFIKSTNDQKEQSIIIINKNDEKDFTVNISYLKRFTHYPDTIKDITPQDKIHRNKLLNLETLTLQPSGIKVFYFQSKE